jgi:hypothetical protein
MSENGNFIDFVIAAKDDEKLYQGFLDSKTPEIMAAFFAGKKFDVPIEDCAKLIKAKEDFGIDGGGIPPAY